MIHNMMSVSNKQPTLIINIRLEFKHQTENDLTINEYVPNFGLQDHIEFLMHIYGILLIIINIFDLHVLPILWDLFLCCELNCRMSWR